MKRKWALHTLVGFAYLASAGCGFMYPRYGGSEGYVLEMGDAKTITSWALDRTDAGEMINAWNALVRILIIEDRTDQRAALDGAVAFQRKLEAGWLGFEGIPWKYTDSPTWKTIDEKRQADLEFLIRKTYWAVEIICRSHIFLPSGRPAELLTTDQLTPFARQARMHLNELMLRIRPSEQHPERLRVWRKFTNDVTLMPMRAREVPPRMATALADGQIDFALWDRLIVGSRPTIHWL